MNSSAMNANRISKYESGAAADALMYEFAVLSDWKPKVIDNAVQSSQNKSCVVYSVT